MNDFKMETKVNLYTSTAAFQKEEKTRRMLFQYIKDTVDKWALDTVWHMRLHAYMQSLPTEEELLMTGWGKLPPESIIIDRKANYTTAISNTVNLGRYLDLLRDDLKQHLSVGNRIKNVNGYVCEYYHNLMPLAELVLFDDYGKVQWAEVKHLEAIGFIVYWDRVNNRLIIRWENYELVV